MSAATSNGNIHLDAALDWLDMGFSPLPPKQDGTKAPFADVWDEVEQKKTWKPYQSEPASRAHVEAWYSNGRTGNGVATGVGALELFEFDDREVYNQFKTAAVAVGLGDLVERIETGYLEETPGGGIHWFYVCSELRGSTKLAERPDPLKKHGRKTLIETKGEGGFAVVAPSCGTVHETGGAYRLLRGRIDLIEGITAGERQALWDLAQTFDEIGDVHRVDERPASSGGAENRPGDDYAARHSWEDILEPADWKKVYASGKVTYWRRPDKSIGVSATTGHCAGLYVFSTSTSFAPRQTYSKFGAYAHLHHKDDFAAAAKALAALGYGQQDPKATIGKGGTKPTDPPPSATEWSQMANDDLGIIDGETVDPEPVNWLWPHRIAAKKMNIIAGEGKLGKTQTALAMAATVTTGGMFPDGTGPAEIGTVVILSAEDDPADTLAPRLIALGADMTKIKFLRSEYKIRRKSQEPAINPVTFRDLPYWREVFRRLPDCRLFIVDPLPSYLGQGVNDHKNAELRSVLTPFIQLVADAGIAMVAISHVNKAIDPTRPAAHRIMGSLAYGNLSRSIHFVTKDKDNPERRLFMQSDNTSAGNIPAVAFTLKPKMVPRKTGGEFEVWVPEFEKATVQVDVGEQVNAGAKPKAGPAPIKSLAFAEWLWNELKGGPVAIHRLIELARDDDLLAKPVDGKPEPSISPLYNAKDKIPRIHPDWMVADSEVYAESGPMMRAYKGWKLVETSKKTSE